MKILIKLSLLFVLTLYILNLKAQNNADMQKSFDTSSNIKNAHITSNTKKKKQIIVKIQQNLPLKF